MGIKKEIDASALSIILDLVQVSQYQYPIPSTVREVTSNGVDSVKEKNIAKAILSGTSTVEDYFVIREGGIYDGSNFDPSYYDLNYLSDNDIVSITLNENEYTRDILAIQDYGVGLGGRRLEKYFQIGYSSKRNLKSALGKFGIGAKAPLSLNSFFSMTSVYNGVRFEFLVYSDRVVSTVPKFDLTNNVPNEIVVFSDGSIIYGKLTTENNNVLIEVETKRHQRAQIIDAVKTSLMYFKGVTFGTCDQDMLYTPISIQADVIFEDEDILVTQNNRYSKPHLVLNGVNYGYLDFIELELEVKSGPIGIKMDPDQVDVNPSRESVIWSDKTRAAVLSKFATVQEIATRIISEQIASETDYLGWSVACAQVLGNKSGEGSVLGALGGIVDTSAIKPVFPGPEGYVWDSRQGVQFGGWKAYMLADSGTGVRRVSASWSSVLLAQCYVQEAGEYSMHTDKYLDISNSSEAVYILVKPNLELVKELNLYSEEDAIIYERSLLMSLSPRLRWYSDVLVPEDYLKSLQNEQAIIENLLEEQKMSLAALRKKQGKITYRMATTIEGDKIKYTQVESEISLIPDFDAATVYGSTEDKPLLESLFTYLCNTSQGNAIPIILLSQDAFPYFSTSKFTHVREWFHRFDNGHLTTHPYLIGWNTSKLLLQHFPEGHLTDLGFLNNFACIDPKLADDYSAVCNYIFSSVKNIKSFSNYSNDYVTSVGRIELPALDYDLNHFLRGLAEFQLVGPSLDEEGKKALSMKLFGNDKVTSAYGYDEVETTRLRNMLEQTTPYRVMVSSITKLTNRSLAVSQDLEMEIKNYIAFKTGQ